MLVVGEGVVVLDDASVTAGLCFGDDDESTHLSQGGHASDGLLVDLDLECLSWVVAATERANTPGAGAPLVEARDLVLQLTLSLLEIVTTTVDDDQHFLEILRQLVSRRICLLDRTEQSTVAWFGRGVTLVATTDGVRDHRVECARVALDGTRGLLRLHDAGAQHVGCVVVQRNHVLLVLVSLVHDIVVLEEDEQSDERDKHGDDCPLPPVDQLTYGRGAGLILSSHDGLLLVDRQRVAIGLNGLGSEACSRTDRTTASQPKSRR